ncbi:hypothetical protein EDD86DRAFT_211814 [Gorgonomyces haynaldii]|nr:hypothetical protein EDD86DRAFT_211814 [Gorgonomyces haynaldii]
MTKFSPDGRYLAQVIPEMDAFRLRILSSLDDNVIDYLHPKPDQCLGLSWSELQVAMLLKSGAAVVFDLGLSQSKATLQMDAPSRDLLFNGKLAYVLSEDGNLVEFQWQKQKKKRHLHTKKHATTLCFFKDLVCIGGNQIDLVSVKDWKTTGTLQGHATSIISMTSNASHIFSCAQEDRFITRWETDGKSLSFTTDQNPVKIHASDDTLLALLENGQLALWDLRQKFKKSAIPPQQLIELSSSGFSDCVFYESRIMVAYGSQIKPTFEQVDYLSEDGTLLESQLITRETDENQLGTKSKKNAQKVKIVQSTEVQIEDQEPPTLEEKVRQLQMGDGKVQSKQTTQISLQQLLGQAIHSGDVELFNRALMVSDRKMVYATVKRLSPTQVVPLLDQLVVRLQRRPTRGPQLIEWIRACLLHHSTFLLTVPNVTSRLGPLHRTLSARQDTLAKLDRLSGRLDMIAHQQLALENDEPDADLVVYESEDDMQVDSEEEYEQVEMDDE